MATVTHNHLQAALKPPGTSLIAGPMDQDAIIRYIVQTFKDVTAQMASKETGAPEIAWGDVFFFAASEQKFPFATIVTKDYPGFDEQSNLNRPGVFRLNVGVGRETFQSLFGDPATVHDYAAIDRIIPHPAYAAQGWVSVLNPGDVTFEKIKPLIAEAYSRAGKRG